MSNPAHPSSAFLAKKLSPPIRKLGIPAHLILPLVYRHTLRICHSQVGDRVLKGEPLTELRKDIPPLLAATSGVVTAIEQRPVADAFSMTMPSVVIATDGAEQWHPDYPGFYQWSSLDNAQKIQQISHSAICGLGGAGFSTATKLNFAKPIELLIINAVECEPMIGCDAALISKHANSAINGIMELLKICGASRCVIAIEQDQPGLQERLRQAIDTWFENPDNLGRSQSDAVATQSGKSLSDRVSPVSSNILPRPAIETVDAIYPSGAETQLIKLLTGITIGPAEHPSERHLLCFNIATAYSVHHLATTSQPPLSRIITVHAITAEQRWTANVEALFGTPTRNLLDAINQSENQPADVDLRKREVILVAGGSNSGTRFDSLDAPVTTQSNCIQIIDAACRLEKAAVFTSIRKKATPCIRCAECADVCPAKLLPQQLHWYLKGAQLQKAVDFNIDSCLLCGCCDVVCPSHIDLTASFRRAREDLRRGRQEDAAANLAKMRFENRQQRLRKRNLARELRIRQRKAAMTLPSSADLTATSSNKKPVGKDAIAQALARAQKKKQQRNESQLEPHDDHGERGT